VSASIRNLSRAMAAAKCAALAMAVALAVSGLQAPGQQPIAAPTTPEANSDDAPTADAEVNLPERLIDRSPFDRITLDAANNGAVIEALLLELPERRVPDPLPREGKLALRQVSQPSIPYEVAWAAVAKIELYESMLLDEARRLVTAGQSAEAFEYLAFLRANYPELPELEATLQDYLWRDAADEFSGGDGEGAWPALLALYERNPEYPRLPNAVQAVGDALIQRRVEQQDYAAARAVLELLERHFPTLKLATVERWREQFAIDARDRLAESRAALDRGDFDKARASALAAEAILPERDEPRALLREIQEASPEIRIGVTQLASDAQTLGGMTWAGVRTGQLSDPRLVEMTDFGAEGGIYASAFGAVRTSESGLNTALELTPAAIRRGVAPAAVARVLLDAADDPGGGTCAPDFAAALKSLQLAKGHVVQLDWRRPLLRPEAFLQIPLRRIVGAQPASGLWFERRSPSSAAPFAAHYWRVGQQPASDGRPQVVVERLLWDDEAALAALVRGDVDAIDRVPPWQLEQARQAADVVVVQYALPTVHMLVPNLKNPLLAMREYRRALCYGADREGIVRDILLGGEPASGYVALSGPFPAGVGLNDPLGYGYNTDLRPRPYEPRLAALLASVARATLAKRELAERKERGEEVPEPDPTVEPTLPPPTPLVLAHPADPLARVACQALKLQLDRVGMPIQLVELQANGAEAAPQYDLLYVEAAIWEPLVDARRLLGDCGAGGAGSALMAAALDELAESGNWNDARRRLREIHRIAYFDLPVIPLWQTVNHFAHRTWLDGVGDRPLSLYQNLDEWRREFDEP
jgi:hypothetical protein